MNTDAKTGGEDSQQLKEKPTRDLFAAADNTDGVVVLVDVSVLAHLIAYRFSKVYARKHKWLQAYCNAVVHRLAGGHVLKLADGSTPLPVAGVIGCFDTKDASGAYWRHHWLANNHGYKGYKRGRSTSYQDLLSLTKAALKLAFESVGSTLGIEGYEADDIAAYLTQTLSIVKPEQRLVLLTVDSDWLGLVEDGRVVWLGIGNTKQAYCSTLGHLHTKMLAKEGTYKDFESIWTTKAKEGDRSDNLPANSPIEVIHLKQQPDEYNLVKQIGTPTAAQVLALALKRSAAATPVAANAFLRSHNLWAIPQQVSLPPDCPFNIYYTKEQS